MDGTSRRKLRYDYLKELDKGNVPTPNDLGLNTGEYRKFVKELQDDSYIQGAVFTKMDMIDDNIRPTEKGEMYLENNSSLD